MNSFLFSTITVCLVASCALAQYQSANANYQQRKMAPSPQTYGHQANGYSESHYNEQEQHRGPSSAAVSHYDERSPVAPAYGNNQNNNYQQKSTYGRQQASGAGYGQQAAASYAKPAPKYEEPYYPPMPFAWGYDINDGYGGAQYHKENGDEYGKRTGSYGYTDAYGIYRQVDYVADEHGFRATIKTNEPGTANESPADVEMHAYEPPSNYYAGNQNSYSAPAAKSASYQPSQATSSYSAPAATTSSYAAPATSSYSAPAATSSYSAPARTSYGSNQRSSYSARPQQTYSAPAARYEPAAQYSSSVIVPVYQKAAASLGKPLAAVPAKRY